MYFVHLSSRYLTTYDLVHITTVGVAFLSRFINNLNYLREKIVISAGLPVPVEEKEDEEISKNEHRNYDFTAHHASAHGVLL